MDLHKVMPFLFLNINKIRSFVVGQRIILNMF